MDEFKVYVVPESTKATPSKGAAKGLADVKIPALREAITAIQKDLSAAGIAGWSATIETTLELGTGQIIPGGKAGFKAAITIKGKGA